MSMKFYKSYAFVGKDPVIDQLQNAIASTTASYADVSEASGVSKSTLNAWFFGQTKHPQHATVMAVTRAIGFDWRLVKTKD